MIEVPAGQEGMRPEMIPRSIMIERCYYTEEVVNPGTQFYFSINGTGFTADFYRSISVDADALDVEVKNLQLMTANQIRGLIVVGDAATTQYIRPIVNVRGVPAYRSVESFGVVRRGEVLDILLTSIDESGQWGKFKVITNLDSAAYSRIKIEPTSDKLDVSNLKPQLPFYIEGAIEIAPGASSGSYGMRVLAGGRPIFRKQPLVEVVKPDVGKTGSVEGVEAVEPARRPGDVVEFTVKGSGFTTAQKSHLTAEVPGVPTSPAEFTYVSAGKYTFRLTLPPALATGPYGIVVKHKDRVVFERKAAFAVVPPNWIGAVRLVSPVSPGGSGQIQLQGRDLAPDFVRQLRLDVDEKKLTLGPLRQTDDRTLVADLQADAGIAPGDYIIHVYAGDKLLKIPRGNIIEIGS